ncbi:hypothetical protein LPN01_08450 [Sphingomonas sp. A2-49]|uniref:hypothetical protein n=1 Tax=Sphingomonas sp. A2-49 TaxID=1391375 RepID=UPI0021D301F6|nr:hypothetical protein [Sphingomonas sp. A2-49]MCU6454105.1 hypothetical protein [Sphingomonas sp. A2-49]
MTVTPAAPSHSGARPADPLLDPGGRHDAQGRFVELVRMVVEVDTVIDRDPTLSPRTNTMLDGNPALYATPGRRYRAGIRARFQDHRPGRMAFRKGRTSSWTSIAGI